MHRSAPVPAPRRAGFTLIEMMMVVVIIGIVVLFLVPKWVNSKEKAYGGTMRNDLRNLVTAQEAYFSDFDAYAGDLAHLELQLSGRVVITIPEATATGWSAVATHPNSLRSCAIFYGNASVVSPAVQEGSIRCD